MDAADTAGRDHDVIVQMAERLVASRRLQGIQLWAQRPDGSEFAFAAGEARPGVPMRTNSFTPWFCAAKPLIAIALAQIIDSGELTWQEPLTSVIPELSAEVSAQDLLRGRCEFATDPHLVSPI